MTPLRQRMVEDMQLRGLSEKTQEAYVRAVRQLAEHYGKSPDRINEEELRQYFLYLKNDKQAASSTLNVTLNGIKFFYQHTLRREWPTFDLVRSPLFSLDKNKGGGLWDGLRGSQGTDLLS
jgi:integrase/recombinase XerD